MQVATRDWVPGALAGAVTTILTFYFGSSHGSREKNAILDRVVGWP